VRRASIVTLGALALLSGCGSSAAVSPPATSATAQSAAAEPLPPPKLGPVTVTSPRSGHVLHAHQVGDELVATLKVTGRADPKQILYTQASCTRPSCERLAPSDNRGSWSTESVVVAPADSPQLRVDAGYTDPASGQAPLTLAVTLRVPASQAAHHVVAVQHQTPVPTAPLPPIDAPSAPSSGSVPVVVATGSARPLMMIGDSLAVGTRDDLAADLPGWKVTTNGRVSRPLAEGMAILSRTPVTDPRTILAFSLFTNDSPGDLPQLQAAVNHGMAALGARGCAIWATIQRPPLGGVGYARANALLNQMAASPQYEGRLFIVPWSQLARQHPEWIGPDHVHPTAVGYAERAQLYANYARSCDA
jgi:hypothetical protein